MRVVAGLGLKVEKYMFMRLLAGSCRKSRLDDVSLQCVN